MYLTPACNVVTFLLLLLEHCLVKRTVREVTASQQQKGISSQLARLPTPPYLPWRTQFTIVRLLTHTFLALCVFEIATFRLREAPEEKTCPLVLYMAGVLRAAVKGDG